MSNEHTANGAFSTVAREISNQNLQILGEVVEILTNEEASQTRQNISLDQARNQAIFQLTGEAQGESFTEDDIFFLERILRPTQLERVNAIADVAIQQLDSILLGADGLSEVLVTEE